MPKEMVEAMKRGGVDNPYALMNAAGVEHGDSMKEARAKMSSYQKGRKRKPSARSVGDRLAKSRRT
jgi:hypothetical protein